MPGRRACGSVGPVRPTGRAGKKSAGPSRGSVPLAMRIALVHQPWNSVVPPVQAGSIAIWNYEVAHRLARTHDVAAYARRSANTPAEETHQGVRYRRLSAFPAPYGILWRLLKTFSSMRQTKLPEFARPDYYARFATRVARHIARQRADVIHVHNLSHFVPVLRRENPDARILLHMHCEWLTQLPPDLVREHVAGADGIAGCSDYIARTVVGRFPELSGRVGVLYNGVDAESFSPLAGTRGDSESESEARGPVLLYVGRISPEKGIHDLVDAFGEVLRTHGEATLLIVGPDAPTPREFLIGLSDDPVVRSLDTFYKEDYATSLRRRAERVAGGRIRFVGTVPHEDLPALYRKADILVNPSLSEAFGMSIVEASACGVPVVACNTGGMPETMRDGETGALAGRGDVEGLARAILKLLGDEDLRRSLGRRGAEWVSQKFDWERIVADTEARYGALAGRGRGSV